MNLLHLCNVTNNRHHNGISLLQYGLSSGGGCRTPNRFLAEVQVIELLPIVGDHLVVFEGRRLLGVALNRQPRTPQETIRWTAGYGVLSTKTLHSPHGTQVLGGYGLAGCASLVNHFQGFVSSFNRSLGELG